MRESLRTWRRAQLSMQFNWVFVLVIGAVILGFFIMVIKNQEKRSNAEQATDLVETIDTMLVTISSNPDTVETFSIRNAKVEFLCEPGQSRYYIQGAGPVDTAYRALFSEKELRGSSVITWTKTWNVPFEAGTLTYLSDDRTLFLFITDQVGNIARLYEELPGAFPKAIRDPTTLLNNFDVSGYDRYVIITTPTNIGVTLPATIQDPHYRIIPGERLSQLENVFIVDFIHDGTTDQVSVLTEELLWAAIFSEDKDYYECNAEKSILKLTQVSSVLHDRTSSLISNPLLNSRCYNFLTDAETPFGNLATVAGTNFANKLNSINTERKELITIQKLIQRGPLCPYIY